MEWREPLSIEFAELKRAYKTTNNEIHYAIDAENQKANRRHNEENTEE